MKNASRPTLRDVANLSGTSIATASNVISGKKNKFVSDRLKRKVLEAAAQLGYSQNQLQKAAKAKRRRVIAMLVPELYNAIYMRMVQGAQKVATERGYLILICSTMGDPTKEEGYIQSLMHEGVDGFLIAVSLKGSEAVQKLQMLEIPYVVLDRDFPSVFPYDSIGYDDKQPVSLAVRHLFDKGHRKIGFMGYASDEMSKRNDAFRKVCRDMGLKDEDCPMHLGLLIEEDGERMICKCLEEAKCTALVIGSHQIGENIIRAMRTKGISVPMDISIVLIGNPIWTDMAGPGYTAVELPHPEMGSMGMKVLLDNVEGFRKAPRRVRLDCSLVVRSSVEDVNGKMDVME